MAAKRSKTEKGRTTGSPARKGKTGTSSCGLIVRSIKNDPQKNQQVGGIMQQIGEMAFGVKNIEELDAEQRHSWIKFSDAVGRAQGDYASLVRVLKHVAQEEHEADIRRVEAEIRDLDKRRKSDEKLRARDQERKEAREDAEAEREETLFRCELDERRQASEEKAQVHAQGLKERETTRKVKRARDGILLGATVFCILFSAFLITIGVAQDKPWFIGGSSVSAGIAIAGFVKMFFFGWGEVLTTPEDQQAQAAGAG
jgi:hypothetical protein